MICPECLFEIEDDSSYCDQCGAKILICPECGQTGNDKVCRVDGAERVLNNASKNFIEKNFFNTQRILNENHSSSEQMIKLVNKTLRIELTINSGEIVGRKIGKHTDALKNLKQLSSKHASLNFSKSTGWTVTDLGSTNGTKLNNIELTPMIPQKIKPGDSLILANIEFYVAGFNEK